MGGPSIGESVRRFADHDDSANHSTSDSIRSRLLRLIPVDDGIKRLLSYRLSATASSAEVKMEWLSIVEGQSPLWRGIPPDRRETIRAFLVYLESELLKRAL